MSILIGNALVAAVTMSMTIPVKNAGVADLLMFSLNSSSGMIRENLKKMKKQKNHRKFQLCETKPRVPSKPKNPR